MRNILPSKLTSDIWTLLLLKILSKALIQPFLTTKRKVAKGITADTPYPRVTPLTSSVEADTLSNMRPPIRSLALVPRRPVKSRQLVPFQPQTSSISTTPSLAIAVDRRETALATDSRPSSLMEHVL